MKKRILALLLSIVLLVSSVGVTSLLTGDILGGGNTPSAAGNADTGSGSDAADPTDRGQRLTDEETAAIRLSESEISATEPAQSDPEQRDTDASASTYTGSSVLDENNALTIPYDLAYPEEFASEDCLYSGDRIMVKFEKSFRGKLTSAIKKAGITDLEKLMDTDAGPWYIASVKGDVQEVMEKVRALKNVVVAEYDYLYTTTSTTMIDSDTVAEAVQGNGRAMDQWYLRSGNLQLGWDYLRTKDITAGGSRDVIVAVIDTGVDYTHEDLKDNIWVNSKEIPDNGIDDDGDGYVDDVYGVNLETGTGSGMDDNGHGTHVAGIIAAANNNIGIVGLAYNVKIMPIKAGMASGFFTQAQIAKGILYAYDHGADVINMSFGGGASTIAVQDALELAYTRCVLVAAAGNDGLPNEAGFGAAPSYPGALSYVMGVMSVDSFGVESSFTNYDVLPFSSVEYEVYAPGSQILSTIPGNRYATWSGTSMATPYVSAVAALLRSAYPDTDTYPTKFIYGQIAATGNRSAICCDPAIHGVHNLPKIVNVYNALTALPKPEVNVADILVFDDPSLSEKNNGDGVIDAGETVALAFTLRNRWGAASDVTISLDADSDVGIPCPYVEFVRNNVNYGKVGTYASVDYGKTREGEFITGVVGDQSLLVKIADNCPNDYIVALNISLTCKNDLDSSDKTVYSSKTSTTFNVRRGTQLPPIIRQDMTLVKDNYYIVPNATLIQEGVTVTVEPGTQLQFWTDDPHDAYANTAITYLKVDGALLCQGSEEEHIRMFPSELMSKYRVELQMGDSGVIDLSYTDVVNPYLDITTAENCEFSQNYRAEDIYYRRLSSGQISYSSQSGKLSAELAQNCAFYKLGGSRNFTAFDVFANCDSCIFVDSAVDLSYYNNTSGAVHYTNCVFLGNNNYLGENYGATSNYSLSEQMKLDLYISNIAQDASTGATYVKLYRETAGGNYRPFTLEQARRLAAYLGGEVTDGDDSRSYFTIMLPDTTVTDISLESEISIDTGMTYQLAPAVEPVASQLTEKLIYISLAPEIVTVDENGLISPVAPGSGVIRVSNEDGSVYRDVAVNVIKEISLAGLTLPEENLRLDVGASQQLCPQLYPSNTTRTGLIYESSDDAVAAVDAGGVITAVGLGSATITVKPAEGEAFSAAVTVTVVQPATSLSFSENMYVTSLSQAEDDLGLVITPETTTDKTVIWDSSNPEVCYVDDSGKLVKQEVGTATLRATLNGTELFAELPVYVTEADQTATVEEICLRECYNAGNRIPYYFARLSDGTLWQWGSDLKSPKKLPYEGVTGFAVKSETSFYLLDSSGTLRSTPYKFFNDKTGVMTGVERITTSVGGTYDSVSYYVLKKDGTVWGWGRNGYGQLGDGSTTNRDEEQPVQMILPVGRSAVDIVPLKSGAIILLDNGDVYGTGYYFGGGTPVKFAEGVTRLLPCNSSSNYCAYVKDGSINIYDTYYGTSRLARTVPLLGGSQAYSEDNDFYIQNGFVFGKGKNGYGQLGLGDTKDRSDFTQMSKITGAQQVFVCGDGNSITTFIQTDHGLYGAGYNYRNQLSDGTTTDRTIPVRIAFGLTGNSDAFAMTDNNLTATTADNTTIYTLTEDHLTLDFNEALVPESSYALISLKNSAGESLSLYRSVYLDKLTITPVSPLVKGETYTLTVPSGALRTRLGAVNTAITLTFTADSPAPPAPAEGTAFSFASPLYFTALDSDSDDLGLTITPAGQEFSIYWTSSDPAVCYVDGSGTLVKRSTGCAVLRAAIEGTDLSADMLVYVTDSTPAETPISALGITAETRITLCDTLDKLPALSDVTGLFTFGGITYIRASEAWYTTAENAAELLLAAMPEVPDDDPADTPSTPETNPSDSADSTDTPDTPDTPQENTGDDESSNPPEEAPASAPENTPETQASISEDTPAANVENTVTEEPKKEAESIPENTETVPTGTPATPAASVTVFVYSVSADSDKLALYSHNVLHRRDETLLLGNTLALTMEQAIHSVNAAAVTLTSDDGAVEVSTTVNMNRLVVSAAALTPGSAYTLTIPAGTLTDWFGNTNEEIVLTFTACSSLSDGAVSLIDPEHTVTVLESGAVSDNDAAAQRAWTTKRLTAAWDAFCDEGYDTLFYGNAILNRFTETDVSKWLRITAPNASSYTRYGIGGNYWGTEGLSDAAKAQAINNQILDFDDYQSMADLNEGTILETLPETVWPVVRSVSLHDSDGQEITTVGAGKTTFTVTFNRDMDTDIPLQVRFGSSYPYADFEVDGQWVDSRTWQGSTTMTSLIANGTQYWSIANGRSAEGHLKLYKDWGRFSFKIDTSTALAMSMQAEANDNGITLTWTQDDFDTLAGYNVYRSDKEDGQYSRLNSTVIPADTKTFTDTNVTPGKVYYYNFTVVKTDLSESDTSGKISVRAKDIMEPTIYHDGIHSAFTGDKLIISAVVKDNVQVDKVELFYRVTGADTWKSVTMLPSNSKYSAIIPAESVTTEGLEYYIRAFDGMNYAYKGSEAQPFSIVIQESIDSSSLGDVNGDGQINVRDALMVLQAINDRLNLTPEQFVRADLNGNGQLEAVEVLTILQYANGTIGSVKM